MKLLCLFSLLSSFIAGSLRAQPLPPTDGGVERDYLVVLEGNPGKTATLSNVYVELSPRIPSVKPPPPPPPPIVKEKWVTDPPVNPEMHFLDHLLVPIAGGTPQSRGRRVGYDSLFETRSAGFHADLTIVQPVAPPDPQLIFLDGLGNSLNAVDLTTQTVVGQVVVPSTTGPFGIRPSATGFSNEVWVLNSGNEVGAGAAVSVVDLGTQTLVANIFTPSIPQSTFAVPVGIVFTPDGATVFEAFKYDTPDSAGNNGALVVFDAAGRTVTSTMLLKFVPTALLMAPDGSTAYLLSNTGTITYYDVLSGTADLTASTYPPGSNAGYPGAGSAVYIHPDGTRLFWNVGVYLTVFDLTMRTVTNQFNSGLPTTVGRTFSLSQDGSTAFFSDQQGDVAILDTYYGTILAAFNTGAPTSVFGGPPVAP
jgi:hypothetical protein